jgi:hypothetical protein
MNFEGIKLLSERFEVFKTQRTAWSTSKNITRQIHIIQCTELTNRTGRAEPVGNRPEKRKPRSIGIWKMGTFDGGEKGQTKSKGSQSRAHRFRLANSATQAPNPAQEFDSNHENCSFNSPQSH